FPRRQRLHLLVADALEATDPHIAETRPSEVAAHLLQAGAAADRDRTMEYLVRTGQRALEAAAFEEAMRACEAALELIPPDAHAERVAVLEQLGWAERGLSHFDRCIELWDEAAEGLAQLDGPEAAARLLWENGYQLIWLGRFEDAFATYARGLDIIGDEPVSERSALVGALATLTAFAGLLQASEEGFAEAVRIAEAVGDDKWLG